LRERIARATLAHHEGVLIFEAPSRRWGRYVGCLVDRTIAAIWIALGECENTVMSP
jgi:hypothetical protein